MARVARTLDGLAADAGLEPVRPRLLPVRPSEADRAEWTERASLVVEDLLGALEQAGVTVARRPRLEGPGRAEALAAFRRHLLPSVTPITPDPGHPLPRARLRGFVVIGTLVGEAAPPTRVTRQDAARFTLVPVPSWVPRWIRLDDGRGPRRLAAAEDLLAVGLSAMFGGELAAAHTLRIVRLGGDAPVARIEHEPGVPEGALARLSAAVGCERAGIQRTRGILGLGELSELCDAVERG